VVFVPELPRTGTWGATRWLGDRAAIQLSLRYKSNDHLWFTFFHEAGHILKHGRKNNLMPTGATWKGPDGFVVALRTVLPTHMRHVQCPGFKTVDPRPRGVFRTG
jgi:hypothetical protein